MQDQPHRQYIHHWKRRYDGAIDSLRELSKTRPHHHPNRHAPEEIKLIILRLTSIPAGVSQKRSRNISLFFHEISSASDKSISYAY